MNRNLFRTIVTATQHVKSAFSNHQSKCRTYWTSSIKFWSLLGLGTGVSICAQVIKPVDDVQDNTSKLPTVDPSTLTHSTLIRNAASLTVNSASTLLSQTVIALNDALEDYARHIYTTITLMDHEMQILGDEFRQEQVWQLIIQQKSDTEEKRIAAEQLESMFHFAVKVMESASIAAFQAGCEVAAISAGESIHQAETQVESARKIVKQAQERLNQAQAESVEATAKHAEQAECEKQAEKEET